MIFGGERSVVPVAIVPASYSSHAGGSARPSPGEHNNHIKSPQSAKNKTETGSYGKKSGEELYKIPLHLL